MARRGRQSDRGGMPRAAIVQFFVETTDYSWEIHQGGFRYFENAAGLGSEKGIEGKYVIATSELGLSVLEVVAIYKDLSDVERGFRQLKDVLAMRPIYHQIEARVKAHIFVAALALLVQRLLDRRLEEAGINFSAERAMEALQTVRLVTFRMDDRPERRGVSGGCPDVRRVLKALKLTDLKPPTPPEALVSTQLPVFCNLFCCKRLGSFQWRRLPCQFQRHHG